MDRISSLIRFINAQGNPETAKNTPTRYTVPLRFQGTVVNVKNNLCYVRWNDDPRDFDEFQRKISDYLTGWDGREDHSVDYEYLEVGKFYLVQSEKHIGRCRILKRADSLGFTTFYMIDEGVVVTNSRGTFYNLPPEFSKGSLGFSFTACLASADEFQLAQLNLKSGFEYLADAYENDVFDIFVLSGEEPYCAIIGSDATLKSISGIGLDISSISQWENLITNPGLSSEVVPVYDVVEPRYIHGLRTVAHYSGSEEVDWDTNDESSTVIGTVLNEIGEVRKHDQVECYSKEKSNVESTPEQETDPCNEGQETSGDEKENQIPHTVDDGSGEISKNSKNEGHTVGDEYRNVSDLKLSENEGHTVDDGSGEISKCSKNEKEPSTDVVEAHSGGTENQKKSEEPNDENALPENFLPVLKILFDADRRSKMVNKKTS